MEKPPTLDRRGFLSALGVTVGGGSLAGASLVAAPQLVKAAAEPPKAAGKIPDTPYKTGHLTFLTGPERFAAIADLEVYDLRQDKIVPLKSLK